VSVASPPHIVKMDIIQGAYSPHHPLAKSNPFPGYALNAYDLYNSADPYLRPIRSSLASLQSRAYPIILPYLNNAALMAQDSPGIITVGILLLFLLIAMQILNFIRRVMMFWIRLMTRIMFWGGVVLLGAAVCQRGVGRSVEDIAEWGRELSDVWWKEYRRWEGYQNQARRSSTRGSWS
jgi:hypothetical protein